MNAPPKTWSSEEFADLLAKARDGCSASMGELLMGYQDHLIAIARRTIPKPLVSKKSPSDLFQETGLLALKKLPQFAGPSQAEFTAWLRKILEHALADFQRSFHRQKRQVSREEPLDPLSLRGQAIRCAEENTSPLEWLSRREAAVALSQCLCELPPEEREALRLRSQGLSHADIASTLNVSQGEARSRVLTGLRLASAILKEFGTDFRGIDLASIPLPNKWLRRPEVA